MPVRIAHVVGALDYGGVETNALNLIRYLPPDEFISSVIYTGESESARKEDFEKLAAFAHCPYIPGGRVDFIRRLRSVFRTSRIEVSLSYAFGNHFLVCAAARLAGVERSYVRVAGSPSRGRKNTLRSILLAHAARPVCSGEIAVSGVIREELARSIHLPARRIRMIPNGCDTEGILERATRARAGRTFTGEIVVLMVARMDDAKDQGTLIHAVAQVARGGVKIRVDLAGDGPERAAHERLCQREGVSEIVCFLGNRRDVPELLGASDIAVLATRTEGMPNTLLEAMSARTPIVATDIPICREVLRGGDCGVLVPPGDANALAEAIHSISTDGTLRRKLTDSAFQRVTEIYGRTRMVEEYARLLRSA